MTTLGEASTRMNAHRITTLMLAGYTLVLLLAVMAQRHLFADAAWLMVDTASTGRVTASYVDFWREFYHSRAVALFLDELPLLAALHAGVKSVTVASGFMAPDSSAARLSRSSAALCYWIRTENPGSSFRCSRCLRAASTPTW